MATISVSSELDILTKYEEIMATSLGAESVYVRVKETLETLLSSGDIASQDKGQIVSTVLGNLTSSLVSAGLSAATQWALQEKELELKILEMSKQLDLLDAQVLIAGYQAQKTKYENIATQATTIRTLGTPTVIDDVVVSLADEGQVWQSMEMVKQQILNLQTENTLIDSKLQESYAGVYKVVSDSLINYGAWNYTIGANGITGPTGSGAPTRTPISVTPLSDLQGIIAGEQAKGYSYNAWANAVTASAGMIGTAVASDGAISEITNLVTAVSTGINNLNSVSTPTIP